MFEMKTAIFILCTVTLLRAQESQDVNKVKIPVRPTNGLWIAGIHGGYWHNGGAHASQNNISEEADQINKYWPHNVQGQNYFSHEGIHSTGGGIHYFDRPHEQPHHPPMYYSQPLDVPSGNHFSNAPAPQAPSKIPTLQYNPYPVQAKNPDPLVPLLTSYDDIRPSLGRSSSFGGNPTQHGPHSSHDVSSHSGPYPNHGGIPTQHELHSSHYVSSPVGSHPNHDGNPAHPETNFPPGILLFSGLHSTDGENPTQPGPHFPHDISSLSGSHFTDGGNPFPSRPHFSYYSPGRPYYEIQPTLDAARPTASVTQFVQSESDLTPSGIHFSQRRLEPTQGGSPHPGSDSNPVTYQSFGSHSSLSVPHSGNHLVQDGTNFPIHHGPNYLQSGLFASPEGNYYPLGHQYPIQGENHYPFVGLYPNIERSDFTRGEINPTLSGTHFPQSRPQFSEVGVHFSQKEPSGGFQFTYNGPNPIPGGDYLQAGSDIPNLGAYYPYIPSLSHDDGNPVLQNGPDSAELADKATSSETTSLETEIDSVSPQEESQDTENDTPSQEEVNVTENVEDISKVASEAPEDETQDLQSETPIGQA